MMHRNLDRRVEALVRVTDRAATDRIAALLSLAAAPGHQVLDPRTGRLAAVAGRRWP